MKKTKKKTVRKGKECHHDWSYDSAYYPTERKCLRCDLYQICQYLENFMGMSSAWYTPIKEKRSIKPWWQWWK